jgi:hypothetical protein
MLKFVALLAPLLILSGCCQVFWHLHVGRRPHIYRPPRKCRSATALSENNLEFCFGCAVGSLKCHRLQSRIKMSLFVLITDWTVRLQAL